MCSPVPGQDAGRGAGLCPVGVARVWGQAGGGHAQSRGGSGSQPLAIKIVGRIHFLVGVGPRAAFGVREKGLTLGGFGLCLLVLGDFCSVYFDFFFLFPWQSKHAHSWERPLGPRHAPPGWVPTRR